MSLQWKIEDGELLVWRKCGTVTSTEGTKPYFAWIEPRPKEAAAVLLADRAATQEKCAQWHDQQALKIEALVIRARETGDTRDVALHRLEESTHRRSASAIRSLNLTETGQ